MNQPAHDWALLQDVDEDAERELLREQTWWQAQDDDLEWQEKQNDDLG